jgi:hypothetical protein
MIFSLDDQGEKMSRETSYDTPLSNVGHFCDIAQKIVGVLAGADCVAINESAHLSGS